MEHVAQNREGESALISVDWIVLVVGCLAAALVTLTMLRTDAPPQSTRGPASLEFLQNEDVLVAFQDFSFGAGGWIPGLNDRRSAGLGPVLGRFSDEAVRSSFAIPANAGQATVRFDLFLSGDWTDAEAVTLLVGGAEIMRLGGAYVDGLVNAEVGTVFAAANARTFQPVAPDENTGMEVVHYAVEVTVTNPAPALDIAFRPELAAGRDGANWALDNVSVVARPAPPTAES